MIADLHIHSRFSRATSRDLDFVQLELWARRKGIDLIGTGDCTHPSWCDEMRAQLIPDGAGLYRLRTELAEPDFFLSPTAPRFIVTGEISCIYKQAGRTRKVHNLVILPSIEAADALRKRLERIGNLHSDGRPILGLSSRDLAEITFDVCPDAVFVPAHIWTPHFSMLGAFSGFESVEDCFGDMAPYIHALETGLSSDPPMNRRVSALDGYTLLSNSDAHSPAKLAREANILHVAPDYASVKRAIETGEGFGGTVEFYPEEGKYHLDGHRNCNVRLTPAETAALGGICPVCGKKLTVGVLNRVEALADRPEGFAPDGVPFRHLMPLVEVIGASLGISADGAKAEALYRKLLAQLGPELNVLEQAELVDVRRYAGEAVAEGIRRLRCGEVRTLGGFDGQYGTVALFDPSELQVLRGQIGFLPARPPEKEEPRVPTVKAPAAEPQEHAAGGENDAQQRAVDCDDACIAVIAGPGTGKTHTLVARIARLLATGVPATDIATVTFTRLAAAELRERLRPFDPAGAVTVGTFHALCQKLLNATVADRGTALDAARKVIETLGIKSTPARFLADVSACKNGRHALAEGAVDAYTGQLRSEGVIDFDDLLDSALESGRAYRFGHLLVDEFQDVNLRQYRLALLWSQGGNLFVIGDPDQSIYKFRGAESGCFERLQGDRPTTVLRLTRNYRSTPQILGAAAAAIGGKPLDAMRGAGKPVRLVDTRTDTGEAVFVAKEIGRMTGGLDMLEADRSRRENARPFSEIAVLARTHRRLKRLETALLREGIPFVTVGRDDWLDDTAVRGALTLARYVLDPDPRYLHDAAALLYEVPLGDAPLPAVHEKPTDPPSAVFAAFAERFGLHSAAYAQLSDAAAQYDDLSEMLDCLLFGEDGDVKKGPRKTYRSGSVRLMTLHAAKGLEFPVVFLCGLTADEVPHATADADEAEERRLFYVGLTRARDELILSTPGNPSPFVRLPALKKESAEKRPTSVQLAMF